MNEAMGLLEMLVLCDIPTEACRMVTLRTTTDVERVFDIKKYDHPEFVPGRYLSIASDQISDYEFGLIENAAYDTIITDRPDKMNEDEDVPVMYLIYLAEKL